MIVPAKSEECQQHACLAGVSASELHWEGSSPVALFHAFRMQLLLHQDAAAIAFPSGCRPRIQAAHQKQCFTPILPLRPLVLDFLIMSSASKWIDDLTRLEQTLKTNLWGTHRSSMPHPLSQAFRMVKACPPCRTEMWDVNLLLPEGGLVLPELRTITLKILKQTGKMA